MTRNVDKFLNFDQMYLNERYDIIGVIKKFKIKIKKAVCRQK